MAFALRSDGINDYISVVVSSDDDVIEVISNIQFDVGVTTADRKIIAFNPAGNDFYGFGIQNRKLRIFARGGNGQFTQVSSVASINTGAFIEAKWRFEKLTGKASVFIDGVETTTTNALNTDHDTTISATAIMSNEGAENLPCLAKDFVFMDATTPANSINFSFDKSSGSTVTDSINSIVGTLINYPTDDSQWVDLGGSGVTVTATEILNSFADSSVIDIDFNVSLSVTEVLSPFTDTSTLSITSGNVVLANITETLNAFSDSSVINLSANVSATVTEVLNSFLDGSTVTIAKDITVEVTEVLASFVDSSALRFPTNWVDKPAVITSYTTQTPVTTIWTDKG